MAEKEFRDKIEEGLKIAQEYEKLNEKYNSPFFPTMLGAVIIQVLLIARTGVFAAIFKQEEISVMAEIMYFLFFMAVLAVLTIPSAFIISKIPLLNSIAKFIGKLFLVKNYVNLKKEIDELEKKFTEELGLHKDYLSTEIMEKFLYYVDLDVASNLKECYRLYREDTFYEKFENVRKTTSGIEAKLGGED